MAKPLGRRSGDASICAFRSAVVDGTAHSLTILMIPASYDPAKPIPLYVYLHGRSQYDPGIWAWAGAGGNDRPGGNGGNRPVHSRRGVWSAPNNSLSLGR